MSQSADTRDRLIQSAIKVFSEKGYFNTKISDIVKEAGYAQGTFYIYFSSKEDIFFQIIELIVGQIEDVIARYKRTEDRENLKQLIYSFSSEMFYLLYQYKEVAYIFFFQLLCMQEKFRKQYLSTYKKFLQFYEELFIDHEDRKILAGMIVSFGEKLFKLDVLIERKELNQVLQEFNKGIEIILRGVK